MTIEFQIVGAVISPLVIVWYFWVETKWLRVHSRLSRFAAARSVIGTWFKASLLNALISFAILGSSA